MPHTGLIFGLRSELKLAVARILHVHYQHIPSLMNSASKRNQQIKERYQAGELMSDLARDYGISPQRIHQIVHGLQH